MTPFPSAAAGGLGLTEFELVGEVVVAADAHSLGPSVDVDGGRVVGDGAAVEFEAEGCEEVADGLDGVGLGVQDVVEAAARDVEGEAEVVLVDAGELQGGVQEVGDALAQGEGGVLGAAAADLEDVVAQVLDAVFVPWGPLLDVRVEARHAE